MSPRKTEVGLSETETIIGAGAKVKGSLTSDGDVSIDGELKGSIKAGGNLTIGVNGLIEANISARNVRVGGQLVGNVNCENETVIEGTGKVKGDIRTGLLAIEQGALFSGQSFMHEGSAVKPSAEEKA